MQKEPLTDTDALSQDITARDQAFARMFRKDERVWLINEQFNDYTQIWHMDFLRPGVNQGYQGRWMIHRYHYEVPTGVIYFMGERPVDDEELPRLRRAGKPVQHSAQTPTAGKA